MEIRHATLDTCGEAAGVVVVIDVIRAFTTAAFAFAAGAHEIIPVGTVEQALELRARLPNTLLMGEVHGFPPPGFDYGNSPAALRGLDFRGKTLIQRTSAGTQGLVRCLQAGQIFAASLVCASATVRAVQRLQPAVVTLVSTGIGQQGGEDVACADHLEILLRGGQPDPEQTIQRVHDAVNNGVYREAAFEGFIDDLACCIDIDRFNQAMPVVRRDGLLVMAATSVP